MSNNFPVDSLAEANTIPLPGLIGSNPLGALTAFGLLKVLSEEFPGTKLAFEMRDDWVAVLHNAPFDSSDGLVAWLSEWVKKPELNTLINWGDDVRMPVAEFRAKLTHSLETNEVRLTEIYSALVSDGAVDKSKGLVKPSLFYMVSGQQSFLGGMREVLSDIRANPVSKIKEALIGPWALSSRLHGLGLDPGGERLYALRSKSPTGEKPASVTAATWLAFIAMVLLPSLAQEGQQRTLGFQRKQRDGDYFQWPIFTAPLTLASLKTLLQSQSNIDRSKSRLRNGIGAVFQSKRFTFGQGYAVFRPAREKRIDKVDAL